MTARVQRGRNITHPNSSPLIFPPINSYCARKILKLKSHIMITQNRILTLTFNHVVLPPRLPGRQDSEAEAQDVQKDLVHRVLDALESLKGRLDEKAVVAWEAVEKALNICKEVNHDECINEASLLSALAELQQDSAIILYVAAQNACILLRKPHDSKETVIFEAFETSPAAEPALTAKGSLQWDFPGAAVSLPLHVFENPVFLKSLATFLERASCEVLDEFIPKTRKAGAEISETRDTVNPAIITQFLMTLLQSNGCRIYPPVLRKRVKDDVCWENAELPWRRSPFWLALRVCIQRLLYLRLGPELGRIQYKFTMCTLMARLLSDSVNILDPEQCNFLKTKLCRRLAKLEMDKQNSSEGVQDAYARLLAAIGPYCQQSISKATAIFEAKWKSFRSRLCRRIPLLPNRAEDKDLKLALPNSLGYMRHILNPSQVPTWVQRTVDPTILSQNSRKDITEQFGALMKRYFLLAEKERAIESDARDIPGSKESCEALCIDLAHQIDGYIGAVGNAYDDDPEQMSIFILSIFELWVHMDRCATVAYPLLKDYHPWIKPEMLDVILLSRWDDMDRLQRIQLYLHTRCTEAKSVTMTIFTDPDAGGFTDRYFDLAEAKSMRALQGQIESASLAARNRKEAELQRVNAKYKDLTEKKASSSCTDRRNPDGTHDIKGCSHCYYGRCRWRLKIGVHEDFLPPESKRVEKRAITFELSSPKPVSAYRDSTWNIITTLCYKADMSVSDEPEMFLCDYSQLKKYNSIKNRRGISLASDTKSYLGTHYKSKKLPAKATDILLPLGLKFSYYDEGRKIWLRDFPQNLTFAHHFAMHLPRNLPFSALYASSAFVADGPGPSSYTSIAKIPECPSKISVHEFIAHQNLIGGKNRRWFSILSELGSSNINFSLQDTMVLFRLLALQAGPRLNATNDTRRAVHFVFRDANFCDRLIEQILVHVKLISPNWRESNYMETLLILTNQICAFCCVESRTRAQGLLLLIRKVTTTWITLLRNEMRNAQEADTAERMAMYCFLSTLLCRRTFVPQAHSGLELDAENFRCFIEATLAMQESLVIDLSKFTSYTRSMLVRDIKMMEAMRPVLRESVTRYPASLGLAIDAFWPNVVSNSRSYIEWEFLLHSHEWWVTSTIQATEYTEPQVLHYHLLEGHLLVDGRAMGKLPTDIRDSETLKELFGNQRLVAFPSSMPGMSYTLAMDKEGHRVHIGYREQQVVIRAQKSGRLLELIPRHVFGHGQSLDLPIQLVDNCVHWMDIQSGIVEVRRQPHIWKDGAWTINVLTRRAMRRHVHLVDPHCALFALVAQIFEDFEQPHMLMVVQSLKGTLSVELKRMDLTFYVNRRSLLQCKQLSAEIDPNQDAGTLYGLKSMLILRNIHNRSQRSVITMLGRPFYERLGMHVVVRIENTGSYARYTIDKVLGRLYSPPEPRLLYNKAQLHALTSFFLPDPLTGRTGTEEALSCLQSGYCQPSTPLNWMHFQILETLSTLTPRREYYPKGRKCQQSVFWDPKLTTTIQHDAYKAVVDSIVEKSEKLSLFHLETVNHSMDTWSSDIHLQERARWRRSIYERGGIFFAGPDPPQDMPYATRDGWTRSQRMSNVSEVVTLLRKRPLSLRTTTRLVKILQKWPVIGGYTSSYTASSLHECLDIDLGHEWGSLVLLCRDSKPEDSYQLMFQLGIVAYESGVDMEVLRSIVAFSLLDDLKQLQYPPYSLFTGFEAGGEVKLDALVNLAMPFYEPYRDPPIQGKKKKRNKTLQEIRRMELAREEHELRCVDECQRFAVLLQNQWPCAEPTVDGFESTYLNVHSAMKEIIPEWQRLYKNLQLFHYVQEVQRILDKHSAPINSVDKNLTCLPHKIYGEKRGDYPNPLLGEELLQKPGPIINAYHNSESVKQLTSETATIWQTSLIKPKAYANPETMEIESIIGDIMNSSCPVRLIYGQDLKGSIAALKLVEREAEEKTSLDVEYVEGVAWFNSEINRARTFVDQHYNKIVESLSHGDSRLVWLQQSNLWPCMMPLSILQQLGSKSHRLFGPGMKDAIIAYGLAIVQLQRLIRMKDAFTRQDKETLHQEYKNRGHVNWQPSDYPDWLLLEIDANMQIRKDQVTVALEMISPSSGSNSVLQMNMGQGKTSVIMPMVASILADGKTLTRILVPNALLSQTTQVLQSRLGGLLGREITHIPFSRRTPTSTDLVGRYRWIHEDQMNKSAIIVGVPEHVLSFKLSGIQQISDSKIPEASKMVATQRWMDQVCRDILDECDFTLAVKTQLIYPSGSQLLVDGHPNRWEVTMAVLGLVAHHLHDLAQQLPQSIEIVERTATGFPVAYFLRKDAEEALTQRIINNICSGETSLVPIRDCKQEEQEAIRIFLSQEHMNHTVSECVSGLFPDVPKVRKNVYLLRGLLVHGILLLCLKKRWNVQYGLHPRRDPIAVPFHAKGVPSDQAEWGHPDVSILFTCLAFYNQGLSQSQLLQSLQGILRSDDPATEYDQWTQTSLTLPEPLRYWNTINVDDESQVTEVWRHLRKKMVVINHFLKNYVFPVHAKQFSVKIQASGWDIPLFNNTTLVSPVTGVQRLGLTCGFSGTNDNRRLLPLTIKQQDLPQLLHTNAEVLTYLLQQRNRSYQVAVTKDGSRFSELDLVTYLMQSKISVLIDAGAFILEMDNRTLVRTWLQGDTQAQAAIYFGPDNKPWVQYQNGKIAPLVATPFADNMENCLVYLDEAHTRGTDLKLPVEARGALTLALNQSKDHTVQAAMRLRQLGTTQSVSFVAPLEVHQSILDVRQKSIKDRVDSSDVITWLLHQTCTNNRELQSLYFAQGADFCYRMQAVESYKEFLTNVGHRKAYIGYLQQPEQQTLERLYEPKSYKEHDTASLLDTATLPLGGKLSMFMEELRENRRQSHMVHGSVTSSALEEVEQEREVAYEIEEEREMQRPPTMKALKFPGLHKSILIFLQTGILQGNGGYMKASCVLESSELGLKHRIDASTLLPQLYVSAEFTRTVKMKSGKINDNFMSTGFFGASRPALVLLSFPKKPKKQFLFFVLLQRHPCTYYYMRHHLQRECYTLTVWTTMRSRAFRKSGFRQHGFHSSSAF
ncbi:hypothetical protein BDV25DRAFT_156541 [Aspergillus avenaceus]|uniref:ubiquitinyl hydrolase 1 n=1 Tax=Aspergillus avenaceus TaxID=36643 RepID=A0A5N6TSR9_ASPAV|nr:hypothetical protein BDV25DRAFT_156541 [Aspergillus avenaceus]